jgi:hypothetical protein
MMPTGPSHQLPVFFDQQSTNIAMVEMNASSNIIWNLDRSGFSSLDDVSVTMKTVCHQELEFQGKYMYGGVYTLDIKNTIHFSTLENLDRRISIFNITGHGIFTGHGI